VVEIRIFIIVMAIIFIIFVVVMNILSNYYQPADTSMSLSTEKIEFTLETEKNQFKSGEPVNIKLDVKNITEDDLTLEFETTNHCEFTIRREMNFVFFTHGLDVWRSSYNQKYEDEENKIILKPGQSKTFKTTWKQINSKGELVKPGRYSISVALLTKTKQPLLQLKMKTK